MMSVLKYGGHKGVVSNLNLLILAGIVGTVPTKIQVESYPL